MFHDINRTKRFVLVVRELRNISATSSHPVCSARQRGVLMSYTGLSLGDGGNRRIRVGMQWQVAPEATLSLEGTREESVDEDPVDAIMLRATMGI